MTSPKETPRRLPPWVDPIWGMNTPEARQEQLRRLARAQARGSALFLVMRGMDVESALAAEARAAAKSAAARESVAAEEEADEAWVCAVPEERKGDRRWSHLALVGAVIFVLGVLCGVVLMALRLR